MKPGLPQPFSIEDIQKRPKAVVISLLIGLLIITCSVIAYLFQRKELAAHHCEDEKQLLLKTIIEERDDRIKLYEGMIFYKHQSESLKTEILVKDSIVRDKTEHIVKKILQ